MSTTRKSQPAEILGWSCFPALAGRTRHGLIRVIGRALNVRRSGRRNCYDRDVARRILSPSASPGCAKKSQWRLPIPPPLVARVGVAGRRPTARLEARRQRQGHPFAKRGRRGPSLACHHSADAKEDHQGKQHRQASGRRRSDVAARRNADDRRRQRRRRPPTSSFRPILPEATYSLVLRGDLLGADGKQVLATTYAPALAAQPAHPVALALTSPAAIEARAGLGETGKFTGKIVRQQGSTIRCA